MENLLGKEDEAKKLFSRPENFPEDARILTLLEDIDIFDTDPPNRILVRAAYKKAIRYLEERFEERRLRKRRRATGVVVTGQSGIGKDYPS
jgi:DNA replication protein DnaC